MPKVMVIEDDDRIRAAIESALARRGHDVHSAATALDGLRETLAGGFDVLVLDLMLPDIDGLELLRMLRAVSAIPVIVATARDDEAEIVRTLDAGADDYVTKPFSSEQLDARIRAVLRRTASAGTGGEVLEVGGLRIDTRTREVLLDGAPLELSRKEYDMLALLASRQGAVVARSEIMAEVWRQPYGGADKSLDVHLSWLRKKLGESAEAPRYLRTVRGVGVRLSPPHS